MMNRFFTLILGFLAVVNVVEGQTFLQVGTGTATPTSAFSPFAPVYRASSNSNTRANRSNTLYEATELSALPAGAVITALAWEKANAGGTVPGSPLRLEIWMRNSPLQAPLSTSTTWSSITTSHTLVYNDLNAVIPTVPGWVNFTLNTPFTYTGGGLEIATENQIGGSSPYATDRFDWVYTPNTGDFVIGVTGSTSLGAILNSTTTSGAKNRSNIRIFYTVPLPLDLQAEAIVSPAPPIAGGSNQQVQLRLFNGGTNAITSANLHYRVNGGPIVTESWTGTLAPSTNTTVSFAAPFNAPLSGNVDLQAWVSNINGQGADGNTNNDTTSRSLCLALPAGNYSVGTPSSAFPTLQSAINALNCGGIMGPVVMQIASGTYTLSSEIFEIPGASAMGAVTFTPASSQLGDVTIVNDSTAQVSETLILSGTKGVTFSFLRFTRSFLPTPNTPTTHVIHMRLGAERIQVVNCAFVDQVGLIDDVNRAIGMFAVHNNQLIGNSFEGFGHAVFAVGEGFDLNNQWLNNTFSNYLDDAMFLQAQQGAVIRGNRFIDFQGTGTAVAACSLRTHRNVTVDANRILGSIPRYALYLYDFDNHVSGPNRITNNEAVGYTATTITSGTAIRGCYYIQGFNNNNVSPVNIRDQFDFINNTAYLGINTGSTSSTQALLYVLGGADANPSIDSINILNNNLVAYPSVPGGIPAAFRIMTFNVAAAINAANSNNNNFYFEEVGNPLIRLGSPATDYQTVAAWDSLRNRDSLSLSVNPFFVSPSLGIPTVDTLDNKGTPTYVTTDLNGSPRSATTPDIGAYEFDVLPVELALTNLVAPVSGCGISDSSIVRVQVGNLGTDTLRNVELSLYMNGQWLETKLFTNTILPGLNAVLSFDTVLDLSLGGRYAFSIYPALRVDANPANDTLNVLVVNQLINNFPFVENFDAYQNGIPAFENGWTSSSANYRWFVNNGRTTTNGTGPAFDATTGSPSGRYLYVESSNGIFAQEATVTSSCLDLSGLTQPMLEFYYHGHGVDCYQLIVEQQVAANWVPIDTLEGPTHQFSRQAWLRHRLALNPAATALRFRALRGTAFEGDWAIDDIRIAAWPSADARVAAVRTVVSSCDSTGSLPVTLELRNEGTTALAQVPVGLRVGNGTPISALLNRSLAPGASDTLQISVPFGAGNNQLRAYTSVPNDGDFRIDTVSTSVFLSGTVAQFPYIDNFETASNWHAGGINSSWQRATPAATVINSAFNGSNSWVTNPIGFVNAEERSWLESPCFNFSQLLQPVLSFALWYNTPATAGANMQYSTNNGQSWQVLGSTVSGANWYTNDSILISGGQPVWSGIINNPSGWRQVQLPLGFLAGQSSVKFRFQLFSPANAILGEGIAIDSFRIAEISASLPTNVQITPPSCSPVSHTVTAGFTNMAGLQSAEVVYRVDASGTTQSVPMTQAAGVWSAVIPPAQAGERVTWYIRSTAANVYNAPAQMYVDGFVSPDIQAGTGVPGDSITVDSRLAVGDSMFVGTNPVQNVQGAVFVLQANRHLSLNKIRLALNRTTDLQLYFVAGTASAGGVQNALYVPLGSFNQVVPGNDSFAEVVLPTPLQMQAGQSGWLYISSSHANALPVEVHSGQLLVSGTDLNVLSGFESISSFQFGGSRVIPRLRLFTSNPVQQVEWLTAGTSPTVLGTGSSLRVRVGTSPVSYQVRFTRLSCLITDTFTVVPTGIRDMAVTRIVSPTQWSQVQNDPVNVQVILKNMGTLASNATQLRIFANGVLVQTAQLNNLFEPGDTLLASVNGVNLQAQGSGLQLCAGSGLGDDVPANDSICLFIPSTTNVWEQQNGRLQLYPNPANEQVLLSWDQPLTATTQLAVRDGLGRVVFMQELVAGSTQVKLETLTYPAGWYLVELSGAGQLVQRKLVVRH